MKQGKQGSLLLLGHTDSATTTAGGLGVLTAHTQTGRKRAHRVPVRKCTRQFKIIKGHFYSC